MILNIFPSNFMFFLRCTKSSHKELSIPLTQVSISAHVHDSIARIEVSQVFHNRYPQPLETDYVFQLVDSSAVVQLTIETEDGRVLEAKVMELEEAKEGYSDAVSQGDMAVLGKMEEEGKIGIAVGNIAPNSDVKVKFTVIQAVECRGNQWVLKILGVLFPNLHYERDEKEDQRPLPAHFTYIYPKNCSYRFHFQITVDSSSDILSVKSPSHTLFTTISDTRRSASLRTDPDKGFLPDKDLEIVWETANSLEPHITLQYNPSSRLYSAMLSFIPPLIDPGEVAEEVTGMGEFIYILDRSGSMAGTRLEMAKQSALLFLKSLPSSSTFNIISFGTTINPLFSESQLYTKSTVAYALNALSSYKADLGGTNILLPLDWIAGKMLDDSRPRVVFLLTDGEVENPEAVIGFVEAHVKQMRVFPFGIGHEVSAPFLQYIAKAGNGIAECISHLDDIRVKVIEILQKCTGPALCDREVHWGGREVEQFPSNERLSACYSGEVFRVFASFGETPPAIGSIVLVTGRNSKTGGNVALQAEVRAEACEGEEVEIMFAKQALKELFFRERRDRDPEMKKQIIALSKSSGIPCIYTAFLCVENRTDPITQQMRYEKVPIIMPADKYLRNRLVQMSTFNYRTPSSRAYVSIRSPPRRAAGCCGGGGGSYYDPYPLPQPRREKQVDAEYSASVSKTTAAEITKGGPLLALLEKQQAEGFWTSDAVPNMLESMKNPPPNFSENYTTNTATLWATLLIVVFLSVKHSDQEGEWRLIALKARKWLRASGIAVEDFSVSLASQLQALP